MNLFKSKRHLKYDSVEEWMEAEGITSLVHATDPKKKDELFAKLGELKQAFWEKHLKSLTEAERAMIQNRTHPSQGHSRSEQAKVYLDEFKQKYDSLPYIQSIMLGAYHMDRLVFTVNFSREVRWKEWQKDLPLYYKGFEIKAGFPQKAESQPVGAANNHPRRAGDRG